MAGFTDFQQASLARHNELRNLHSAQPLELDDSVSLLDCFAILVLRVLTFELKKKQMCRGAQRWAEFLAMKVPEDLHDRECGFGENIYEEMCSESTTFDKSKEAVAAANSWYEEELIYDYSSEERNEDLAIGKLIDPYFDFLAHSFSFNRSLHADSLAGHQTFRSRRGLRSNQHPRVCCLQILASWEHGWILRRECSATNCSIYGTV
jgi:hypothetical protein